MIRVSLEFQTTEELVNFFAKPQITQEPMVRNVYVGPQVAVELAPAAKPKGRKPKTESAGAVAPPAAAPSAVAAPAEPDPAPPAGGDTPPAASLDDVRKTATAVLEKWGNERGMNEARKVLKEKAGVARINDLKPEHCAAVVEGLKALLA